MVFIIHALPKTLSLVKQHWSTRKKKHRILGWIELFLKCPLHISALESLCRDEEAIGNDSSSYIGWSFHRLVRSYRSGVVFPRVSSLLKHKKRLNKGLHELMEKPYQDFKNKTS